MLVHEVMHLPSVDRLVAGEPNAKKLREHLVASHTTTEQVGRVATRSGGEEARAVALRSRRPSVHHRPGMARRGAAVLFRQPDRRPQSLEV